MKKVLITGVSSGFGKEMTLHLLKEGHQVFGTVRNIGRSKDVFSSLDENTRKRLKLVEANFRLGFNYDELLNHLRTISGNHFDILINNAGVGHYGPLEDFTEGEIREQFEVNFFAPTLLIKGIIPLLTKSKGVVVNITSLMGQMGMPLSSLYSSSKFALEGLSESLFYELKQKGIQVCTIRPGGHRTEFSHSIKWTKVEKSDYQTIINGLQSLIQKMQGRKNPPIPNSIVGPLNTIIRRKKLPRKFMVGKDARLAHFIQRFLPQSLFLFLTRKIYNKMLRVNT